ncbi:MAG: energy-coupling factor ABC transporter ATP-binding protein [Coriobacteriia bacterium]|nr:energy-coupling factor ABC transporter ATP-binding protein [Coriobacteriia bacterium]
MKELLRLEHIHFRYEEEYPAIKDVSATLYEGERVAVLGGNGAGKSTFFLCCNGVLQPQSGKMFLKGEEVTDSKKDVFRLRQAVGLVFQEPDSQIIAGTVENEVSFGPMNLRLEHSEVSRRTMQALTKMNLGGYQDRAPHYLSGGEKKRVSIADVLAMQPDMILLDEPTASLDPENVALLEQTLNELSRAGITLAISTHDVDFAWRFATRAIVLSGGRIIADACIDEVFASEPVLAEARLKKPLLYAMAELLEGNLSGDRVSWSPGREARRKPRRIEEFLGYIDCSSGRHGSGDLR